MDIQLPVDPRRLRGDPPHQGGSGAKTHPCHCRHFICAEPFASKGCALGNCTFARAAMHRRRPQGVKTSRRNMSAAAAALFESGHGILAGMGTRPRSQAGDPMTLGNMRANGRAVARRVVLAVPALGDPERGPVARSRPVRKRSPPPFQTLSQIGNVITELPAGPAVVPPINGSVGAVGGRAFRNSI